MSDRCQPVRCVVSGQCGKTDGSGGARSMKSKLLCASKGARNSHLSLMGVAKVGR